MAAVFKWLLCLLLFTAWSAWAQKTTPGSELTGTVLDSATHKPLRMASVSLLQGRDSAYVTATITNGDGNFSFRKVGPGTYRLLITYVGYKNGSVPVTVPPGAATRVDTVRMAQQGTDLHEVVIRQERAPVTIREDTLEFNAGSFKTQPNAQVEELLRKLPGVEVARDGSIKANGQSVGKVLVDGKPFFGNDPKMATRNLPADIVDKVQVYDQSSDQSQFSGVDDGDRERTINITIKKDKGKGYFGQNALGAGPSAGDQNARYEARLSVNRFNNRNGGPARQLSLIGQANNLNQQNFTLPGGSPPGGPQLIGQPGGEDDGPAMPASITEVGALGVNYRTEGNALKWGKRAEIAASYFVNRAVITTDQQGRRENVLPGRSFITDQSNYSRNAMTTHRFNGRFGFPVDSLTSIRLTPNVSFQTRDFLNKTSSSSYRPPSDTLNRGLTHYELNGNGLNAYNNLLLMRKFKKEGRAASVNLNSVLTTGNTTAFNRSANVFFDTLATFENIDQRNVQDQFALQNTVNASFTEPLSFTQKLEFRYAYSHQFGKLLRDVTDKRPETHAYDLPDSLLSRNFASTFATNRLGATFQTRRLRYTIALGADLQQASLRPTDRSTGANYQRKYQYLLPSALLAYTFRGNRSLRMQYRTRITPPGITQLIPAADNSNPLNVSIGNPFLKPEYYHNVTLTFNASARGGSDNLFAFASLNRSNNRIGLSTVTDDSGALVTTPINTRGFTYANGVVSAGKKIQPWGLAVNLTSHGSFSRNTNLINAAENVATSTSLGQGIRLQSDYNGRIDYGLSARVTWQQARYSLLPQQNLQYWSQYATADVHWQLPGHLVITSDLTYNGNTGRAEGYNQRFLLWNAAFSRQFLRTRQAEVKLQVFDLLNQNRSLVRNAGDAYIEDVRSRVLKRYFLISLVYNLRKFGV